LERILSLLSIFLILIEIWSYIAISNYPYLSAQKTSLAATKISPSGITSPTNPSSIKLKTVVTNVDLIPKIKILSPHDGQLIQTTENDPLVVAGTSSDDRSKDCSVSVLLNGVKPYQKTIATGNNGASDYSTWKYKLDPSYTVIREGSNKLTAKITCLDNPTNLSKWTSIDLIGTGDGNHNITTSVVKLLPLQISTSVDKNPITAGDIQTITVRVHNPDSANSDINRAKVSGQIIDLSSFVSSSFPSRNMNAVVEQFGDNTDKNGEVSYSWKVPENTPIGTPYIVKVDAVSGNYSGRSESNIFTVKPSSNNDEPFILAQASSNFTNGLNDNIKNFTQEIFNTVRNRLENN
jgi:hypothetical protein